MKQNTIILLLAVVGICVCGGIWLCQGKQVQPAEAIVSEGTNDSLTQQTAEPEDGQIYIHIVGAVKKPGVYTFQKKPRVIEVVEKAGGFTKDAVTAEINQAELVEDGTQLAIASQKDFKEKRRTAGRTDGDRESKSEYSGQRTIDDIDRNWRSKSNCDHSISGRKGEISKTGRSDEYTGDQRRRF